MALDNNYLSLLETAVKGAVPDGVAVAVSDPTAPESHLFRSEAAAVARAVPARRAEFAAGRRAAHQAMRTLGLLPAPVPAAPDRAPVWPDGLVGSISHCDGACVALVARDDAFRSVAIDIEPDADLPHEVEPMVCLPRERAWLDTRPAAERARAARWIFAAKECAYKLQYPLTRQMLDFSAVEVGISPDRGQMSARFLDDCGAYRRGEALTGVIGWAAGYVLCAMWDAQGIGNKS